MSYPFQLVVDPVYGSPDNSVPDMYSTSYAMAQPLQPSVSPAYHHSPPMEWASDAGLRLEESQMYNHPSVVLPSNEDPMWASPTLSASSDQAFYQHSLSAMHHGLGLELGHRHARSPSYNSVGSYNELSSHEGMFSETSRASSPGASDLSAYGYQNSSGTWSCSFPGCASKAVFTRACDLRKHHKRHAKPFFCRYSGCPQASEGGFSSKKDLARHEAKHAPAIECDWDGCDRIFSRVDNMRDHYKRIHVKAAGRASARC